MHLLHCVDHPGDYSGSVGQGYDHRPGKSCSDGTD